MRHSVDDHGLRRMTSWAARAIVVTILGGLLATCSSAPSPAAPSGNSTASQTRIIAVTGILAFGQVPVGTQANLPFTVANTGTSPLTVTGLSYSGTGTGSNVFAASATSGVVPAGGSLVIRLLFTPAAAVSYTGTLTVDADHTGGVNTLPVSGTGLSTPTPPPAVYSISGVVTDAFSRGVLPNVSVEITAGTNAGRETVADGGGRYSLSGLSAGSFTLAVGATSYLTSTRQVTLTANAQQDFVLERTSAAPSGSRVRIGAICQDGWLSTATGSGACSSHGGVRCWRYSDGSCTNP